MDKSSRQLQVTDRKTRSAAEKIISAVLLCVLILQTAACTRIVIYPSEETATAMAFAAAQASESLEPIPAVSATYLPQGGGDLIPTDAPASTPLPQFTPTATQIKPTSTEKPPLLYYTQGVDTLEALCIRFDVEPDEITSPDFSVIPSNAYLPPDKLLVIPDRLEGTTPADRLIPDSEVIFSASAIDFNVQAFVQEAGGYLAEYREWRTDGWYNGGQVIERVAYENSINPRLLLAVVEFQSKWVYGQPSNLAEIDYPIGWKQFEYRELYKQLTWAIQQVSVGYYGWRTGRVTELTFSDGSTVRLAPELNAGTVGVMYMFSQLYSQSDWNKVIFASNGFFALYEQMFGDAWLRARDVEPIFPGDIAQPELILPFEEGKTWNLTGGPHAAWGPDGVMAALDFAPPSEVNDCAPSVEWATAAASGIVTRAYNGIVVIDLDGDGYEQTGWVLFYLHIHHSDRVKAGDWVNVGDRIGHPSCEGGRSTGTHIHIARKYNGEWIPAESPLPFVLDGWTAHNGDEPYLGSMTKGEQVVIADVYSTYISKITRVPKN